jgi:chromosome segregation ATPase
MTDFLDVLLRVAGAVGLPALLIFLIRDRRRVKADASRIEGQVPFEIRTTAATTLEAEVAALSRSFEVDRGVRNETIRVLQSELATERQASVEKDRRIKELQIRVEEMRAQIRELTHQVHILQESLAAITDELNEIEHMDKDGDTPGHL